MLNWFVSTQSIPISDHKSRSGFSYCADEPPTGLGMPHVISDLSKEGIPKIQTWMGFQFQDTF